MGKSSRARAPRRRKSQPSGSTASVASRRRDGRAAAARRARRPPPARPANARGGPVLRGGDAIGRGAVDQDVAGIEPLRAAEAADEMGALDDHPVDVEVGKAGVERRRSDGGRGSGGDGGRRRCGRCARAGSPAARSADWPGRRRPRSAAWPAHRRRGCGYGRRDRTAAGSGLRRRRRRR